jgi:hypothetical protein
MIANIYGQSELSGRYGIGLGWSYTNGLADIQLKILDDDIVIKNSSILDAPKIIVNKFGISERVAIEPTVAAIYYHDKIKAKYTESKLDGEFNRNIVITSLTPIISYAVLQKESVNFYIKSGISFAYYDIGLTTYKDDKKEPEREEHSDVLQFSIPFGIGIEWWILEQLSLDITTSMNLFGFYAINYKNNYNTSQSIYGTEVEIEENKKYRKIRYSFS